MVLFRGLAVSVLSVQGDQSGPGKMRAIDIRGLVMTGDVSLVCQAQVSPGILFIIRLVVTPAIGKGNKETSNPGVDRIQVTDGWRGLNPS